MILYQPNKRAFEFIYSCCPTNIPCSQRDMSDHRAAVDCCATKYEVSMGTLVSSYLMPVKLEYVSPLGSYSKKVFKKEAWLDEFQSACRHGSWRDVTRVASESGSDKLPGTCSKRLPWISDCEDWRREIEFCLEVQGAFYQLLILEVRPVKESSLWSNPLVSLSLFNQFFVFLVFSSFSTDQSYLVR